MLTINLSQFTGYTAEAILDFLHIHNPPILEVLLPKESDSTMPDLIPVDYLYAAYAGQLLSDISTDFMHSIPEPETKDLFSFIIVTTELEALAAHLYYFMAAYTGTGDNVEEGQFGCDAFDWFSCPEHLADVACSTYLEIMDQYS